MRKSEHCRATYMYMRKSSHLDKKSRQHKVLAAKMKMKG